MSGEEDRPAPMPLPTLGALENGSWYERNLELLALRMVDPVPSRWYQGNRFYRWAVLRIYHWRMRRIVRLMRRISRRMKRHNIPYLTVK